MDEPVTSTPTNVVTLNKSAFRNIDKFIKSASISSYKKGIQNVGIVSCFYSLNIQKHNIKDYISLNSESASRVIVPVFHESRIVILAFFAEDFRVEYYDSLKKDYCQQFHSIKNAVENFLGIKFNMTNQNIINEEFNDNSNAELANVHICRIAEALIFNQNKKLNPFDIKEEAKRIYKIMDIVSDPGWKGKWIFDEKDGNYESAFERVKNDTTRRKKCINSLSTSGAIEFEVSNGEGRMAPSVTPTQREININSIIDEVINSVSKRPKTNILTAENFQTDASSSSNGKNNEDATTIETLPEIPSIPTVINNFENKYPILSQMSKFYTNLIKFRNDKYKNAEITVAFQNNFNWKLFSDLNANEKEHGVSSLKDFPYFSEIPSIDKSFLLQRFWSPFWFFERIYDSLDSMNTKTAENFIMLQDKSTYDLDEIINDSDFEKRKKWEKLVFRFWHSLLLMMKEIKPDITVIMYIFCCILWNSDYLKVALSETGEEIIRRGRLIVHKEMREYYDYDEEKWNKIFLLRKMLFLTEKSVQEYKKVLQKV